MTKLTKQVRRETEGQFFEKSQRRYIIIILEPPSRVGLKLKGNRRIFWLDAAALYDQAVKKAMQQEKLEKKKAKGSTNAKGKKHS